MGLKISEVFPAIQGEGKSMSRPTLFIRLSGCNLKCSFCDTSYHIDGHEITEEEDNLLASNKHWTITGGEPIIQQKEILKAIKLYNPTTVEIETNGTLKPSWDLLNQGVGFNCSPKERRFQPRSVKSVEPILLKSTTIKELSEWPLDIVKFVYSDKKSEKFIEEVIKKYKIAKSNVWIMPEGANKKQLEKNSIPVWDYCMKNGFNFGARLHVNVFDTKKRV